MFFPTPSDDSDVSGSLAQGDGSLVFGDTPFTRLVESFDQNQSSVRQALRNLAESNPQVFYAESVSALRRGSDSPGSRFLLGMLISKGMLLRAVCDPALTREEATAMAQAALRVNPMVDVALAQAAAGPEAGEPRLGLANSERILSVLGEMGSGPRIVPTLNRLLRHPDAALRAQAVFVIGKSGQNVNWLRQYLTSSDPRIRSSALQALAGINDPAAAELLNLALRDANRKVISSAIAALYARGDTSSIRRILEMTSNVLPTVRCTGITLIGQTLDPRFTDELKRLLRDPNHTVRRQAAATLGKLREATEASLSGAEVHLTGQFVASKAGDSGLRVRVGSFLPGGRSLKPAAATQWWLAEDSQQVVSYETMPRPVPDSITVGFLLPWQSDQQRAMASQAVAECLKWKRPADRWAISYYNDGDPFPRIGTRLPTPPFFSLATPLMATLRRQPQPAAGSNLWSSLWHFAGGASQPLRCHIIVLSPSPITGEAGHALASSLEDARVSLRVLAGSQDLALERFCAHLDGVVEIAETPEEMAAAAVRAYLQLLANQVLTYRPVDPEAKSLRIRLHTPEAWGDVTVPIPPQPAS
jgi:hypothetical protein